MLSVVKGGKKPQSYRYIFYFLVAFHSIWGESRASQSLFAFHCLLWRFATIPFQTAEIRLWEGVRAAVVVFDGSGSDNSGPTFWSKHVAAAAYQLHQGIAWAKRFLRFPERLRDR